MVPKYRIKLNFISIMVLKYETKLSLKYITKLNLILIMVPEYKNKKIRYQSWYQITKSKFGTNYGISIWCYNNYRFFNLIPKQKLILISVWKKSSLKKKITMRKKKAHQKLGSVGSSISVLVDEVSKLLASFRACWQ